jgi:hypothetical protein
LVILAAGFEGTTQDEQADAEQVVNSIDFD